MTSISKINIYIGLSIQGVIGMHHQNAVKLPTLGDTESIERSWFQVSGTPARHQWLQSNPLWVGLAQTEGWPSILNSESKVTSSRNTGFLICRKMVFSITNGDGVGPGYLGPGSGFCCLKQFSFAWSQSVLLFVQIKRTERLRQLVQGCGVWLKKYLRS